MSFSGLVSVFHTLTVPLAHPETIRRPSALIATLFTNQSDPFRVKVAWPVPVSHTVTVWSPLPETRRWPSALNVKLLLI